MTNKEFEEKFKKRKEEREKRKEEREEIKKTMAEELTRRGIKLFIGACGCCSSPWVSLEIDGKMLADNEEDFSFDNFIRTENEPG